MKNFEVINKKVYVPILKSIGTATKTDYTGNITEVDINGSLVNTTYTIVELWELISVIRKLLILIFAKK